MSQSVIHALLEMIIDKIEEVDFRVKANVDPNTKISTYHYQTVVIDEVLRIARLLNLGLCRHHEFLHLYDGSYWLDLDNDTLEEFLGKAAGKMGVELSKSKYYKFKGELLKQFFSQANLPRPELNKKVLINLKNGTFEIASEQRLLRPFNKKDFLTYKLHFDYDPEAIAPLFINYLNEVVPDVNSQLVLAEYVAYIFLAFGILKLEKVLLLYGSGANGKSVFFEIVNALVGFENVSTFSLQSLTNETGYHRAKLANKLVNYASEISGKMDTAIFKQLASGEPVEARLPYGNPFILTQYAKLIFNCNELPREVEHTNAFFRRFIIIPFTVTIPEERQDRKLSEKIIENELSGVFNWMLAGMDRLLNQGSFTHSDIAAAEVEKYKMESDSVQLFLEEFRYVKHATDFISLTDIYNEYRELCLNDGFKPVSKINFRKRLMNCGYEIDRRAQGMIIYAKKCSS